MTDRNDIITDLSPTPDLTDDLPGHRSRILETALQAVSELSVLWAFGLALLLILAQRP